MIKGHGDDRYSFEHPIRVDFSSNVYSNVDLKELKEHLRQRIDAIGHYPEPEPYTLEAQLARIHGVDPAAVCVTNGATEAIYLIAHAFAGSRSAVLQPTFSEYTDACRLYGHTIVPHAQPEPFWASEGAWPKRTVAAAPGFPTLENERSGAGDIPSNERFSARATEYQSDAERRSRVKPGMTEERSDAERTMIWLCNPNNPTGSVIPKKILENQIVDNPDIVFVIDQSYGAFTQEPLLSAAEAAAYPNLLQLHSMTKRYAMPGLRLGYVTGTPELIDRIRAARMPWSVNALAIEAGLFLCRHPETAALDLAALLAEARRLAAALNAIPGITAETTQTHFMLCRIEKHSAAKLKHWLAEKHGILIRDASNFEGLDSHCFRIATQAPAENDSLVKAIHEFLNETPDE